MSKMSGVPAGMPRPVACVTASVGGGAALRGRLGRADGGVPNPATHERLQPDVQREVVPALGLDGLDPGRGQVGLRAGPVDPADVDPDGPVRRRQPVLHGRGRRRRARVEARSRDHALGRRGRHGGRGGQRHGAGPPADPDGFLDETCRFRARPVRQADLDPGRWHEIDDLVGDPGVGIGQCRPAVDDRVRGGPPPVRAGRADLLQLHRGWPGPARPPGRPGRVPACPGTPRGRPAAGTRADAGSGSPPSTTQAR